MPVPIDNRKIITKRIRPVRPGEPLNFCTELKKRNLWPPAFNKGYNVENGSATPYLIVPVDNDDRGDRPVKRGASPFSSYIEIINKKGLPVKKPVARQTYSLRCVVKNLGPIDCYSGLAVFYAAPADVFDAVSLKKGPAPASFGAANLNVPAGRSVIVTCPKKWTPKDAKQARASIVVQAFDLFLDNVKNPFDYKMDRHVGRRDGVSENIPDFRGVWYGAESVNNVPTFKLMIVIEQTGKNVSAYFYPQVYNQVSQNPRSSGASMVAGGKVKISCIERSGVGNPPPPSTQNDWTFSMPDPDTLHIEHKMHIITPAGIPDRKFYGNLRRYPLVF